MIYLASPYSDPIKDVRIARFEEACTFCAKQARAGVVIYSPIVHWHPVAWRCDLPLDHFYWNFHNKVMIKLCSQLWILMIDGVEESAGVENELNMALYYGKEVKRVEP